MKRPEQELQKSVVQYLRYAAPKVLFFHVPNGGKRSKAEAGIFKAMGVMPGVADLMLFWNNSPALCYPSFAAIELKAGKGAQTDHQKTFQDRWEALGGKYAVVRSLDELQGILKDWGIA